MNSFQSQSLSKITCDLKRMDLHHQHQLDIQSNQKKYSIFSETTLVSNLSTRSLSASSTWMIMMRKVAILLQLKAKKFDELIRYNHTNKYYIYLTILYSIIYCI